MMDDAALPGGFDAALPGAFDAVRAARRERPADRADGDRPAIAIVAERPVDEVLGVVDAAGWAVTGVLLSDVFDGILWASRLPHVSRNYVEPAELLLDPAIDAACLAVPAAAAAALLPGLLHAGMHVLLPAPMEIASDVLLRALDAAEDAGAEPAVAFDTRWSAPAATLSRLVRDGSIGPAGQLTVRGWPPGPVNSAELIDVVTDWCGDVVAVCAAPGALPAERLPGGGTVRWALLTELGTTVLVAHDGAPAPTLRLSCPQGRVELTGGQLTRGGEPVPLVDVAPEACLEGAVGAPRAAARPGGAPDNLGLFATAYRLSLTAGTGDGGFVGEGYCRPPLAGTLRDLFVTARVREALHVSAAEGRWVETG